MGSLTSSAHMAPGLVVFAGIPVLAAAGGGFATATWCLAALFALALLVVAVTASRPALMARAGAWRAALIAYGAFCAWNYLSILWAAVPGDAWDGANRTLLYGLVLVLVGLRPWRAGTAIVALATVAFGVGALALWVLVSSSTGDPGPMFLEGRLAAPTGYANATACLWLIAFWPALHLASRSEPTPSWPLAAAGLAAATLLLEIALLSQSRGAVGGFAIAALSYLLLTPDRARAALRLGVLFALLAAAWAPLTAVRDAASTAGLAEALRDARIAIALSVLVAFAVGAAGAAVDVRLRASPLRRERARRLGARAALVGRASAVVAAVAVIAGLAYFGDPVDWTADRWRDFKTSGYRDLDPGQTRFSGSLGSNRYDFYRVALDEFRAHPVLGIGSDNFAVTYLAERRSLEAPRYPHSLALRLLAQLGAPGAALFVAFLACALAAALRRWRRTPAGRGIVAASVAGFVMWLAHGMVDWLWEFPALTVAAVALLALAATPEAAHASPARAGTSASWQRRARPALGALAVLAAAVSFALPGSAAHAVAAARESASLNPTLAITQLHSAARLNPLSARPLIAAAIVARRAGLPRVGRAALAQAVRREPRNWFAHLQLALFEAEAGRRTSALRSLSAAAALNPRQPVIAMVDERIRRGKPVDAEEVELALTRQLSSKLRSVAARNR